MSTIQLWTLIFTLLTFGLYIYIAYASRVSSTSEFYVAGGGIPAPANGAAIAADWMSAASFISLAGIIAFAGNGYGGSVYLMGWTGGYVLLALLLAPYLRKFGKYTLPDFVGDRYNETARLIAVLAAIAIPAYQDYNIRAQATAGLSDITAGKSAFETKLLVEGISTYNTADIGLSSSTTRCTITLNPGATGYIRCQLAGNPVIAGKAITLQRNTSGAWDCQTDIVAPKHKPLGCN